MYKEFGKRVGWYQPPIFWYTKLRYEKQAPKGHLPAGRSGDIAWLKIVLGTFAGFGLKRIEAFSSKLNNCKIGL